jgi:hypothetical protein
MSRETEPPINLVADEQPTTCSFCGARTDWLAFHEDHTEEQCLRPACGQRFNVFQE